jgi:hypothetical protein
MVISPLDPPRWPHIAAPSFIQTENRAQLLYDNDDIVINQLLVVVVATHVDVSSCLSHILDVLCCTACGRLVSVGRLIFMICGQVLDVNRSHHLTSTVGTT